MTLKFKISYGNPGTRSRFIRRIEWLCEEGRAYFIDCTTNLGDGIWSPVAENIPAAIPRQTFRLNTDNGSSVIYRIGLEYDRFPPTTR